MIHTIFNIKLIIKTDKFISSLKTSINQLMLHCSNRLLKLKIEIISINYYFYWPIGHIHWRLFYFNKTFMIQVKLVFEFPLSKDKSAKRWMYYTIIFESYIIHTFSEAWIAKKYCFSTYDYSLILLRQGLFILYQCIPPFFQKEASSLLVWWDSNRTRHLQFWPHLMP